MPDETGIWLPGEILDHIVGELGGQAKGRRNRGRVSEAFSRPWDGARMTIGRITVIPRQFFHEVTLRRVREFPTSLTDREAGRPATQVRVRADSIEVTRGYLDVERADVLKMARRLFGPNPFSRQP